VGSIDESLVSFSLFVFVFEDSPVFEYSFGAIPELLSLKGNL